MRFTALLLFFTLVFSIFFILCFMLFGRLLQDPAAPGVWSFYLFGDLFSTLMVATFFAFLNDSVSPDAAKRLYGVVGLGGVSGGVFGTSVVIANVFYSAGFAARTGRVLAGMGLVGVALGAFGIGPAWLAALGLVWTFIALGFAHIAAFGAMPLRPAHEPLRSLFGRR